MNVIIKYCLSSAYCVGLILRWKIFVNWIVKTIHGYKFEDHNYLNAFMERSF